VGVGELAPTESLCLPRKEKSALPPKGRYTSVLPVTKRSAQEVIHDAIRENRPNEYTLYAFAILFVGPFPVAVAGTAL